LDKNSDTTNINGCVFQNSSSASDRNGLSIGGTLASFGYYNGTTWIGKAGSIQVNQWTHMVGVNQSGSITFYLNGVPQTVTPAPFVSHDSNYLYIGRNSAGSGPLVGSLDEIRIYNRALSPSEVLDLYNYAPSPLAYWNFEDNDVNSIKSSGTKSTTTTVYGTPTLTTGKYGKAISLNGSTDYLNFTQTGNLPTFTASAWIKTSSSALMNVFSGSDAAWYPSLQTNVVKWHDGIGWRSATTTVSDNNWHYISYILIKVLIISTSTAKMSTTIPVATALLLQVISLVLVISPIPADFSTDLWMKSKSTTTSATKNKSWRT
jgi:hypothetical protein